MSKNKGNKKETNFLLIIIIILIIMVVMSFIGFSILFIKYLDTNSTNSIQNISVETKNEDKISKDLEIEDKKAVSKEKIRLIDVRVKSLNDIVDSLYISFDMWNDNEISIETLGYIIQITKEDIEHIINEGTLYSMYPNIYAKAVDKYAFKLNEFILNLDKSIKYANLSDTEDIISTLEELSELVTDTIVKRTEYLKENGFSDDEIHSLDNLLY